MNYLIKNHKNLWVYFRSISGKYSIIIIIIMLIWLIIAFWINSNGYFGLIFMVIFSLIFNVNLLEINLI